MSGSEVIIPADNLVDILQLRASEQPNKVVYTFLVDGETNEISLTYAQLEQKAKAIATYIQSLCEPQARVLLLYPPGLGFIEAFFGCLYAGVIAVPAYPPRPNRSIERIQSIINSAEPTLALTTDQIISNLQKQADRTPELKLLKWLATDKIDLEYVSRFEPQPISPDNLAFLQYTSGSTSQPKGVIVTHKNVIENGKSVLQHCPIGVSWLPQFHDMGLIGYYLFIMIRGGTTFGFSPLDFMKRPLLWLETISKVKGTVSSAPNFAYDLSLIHISEPTRPY